MATTVIIQPPLNNTHHPHIPNPRRVCFSFAAYAKKLIHHLKTNNIAVESGLTIDELAAVESTFNFTFPPDLRSILQEGLPVGSGFPNWRSSSAQQLEILTNLPILGLCKEISRHKFWAQSWGQKPEQIDEAAKLAKLFLKEAPVLVPICRHCYIPSTPNLAGNPVFYVNGGDVRLLSFDVAGFFQKIDFGVEKMLKRLPTLSSLFSAPAWAATEARTIEFWTELVEGGGRVEAACSGAGRCWSRDLDGCIEDVCCRLRDGGWKEKEVGEMMDCGEENDRKAGIKGLSGLECHLRMLSMILLRAGWSPEDVVDSLGCHVENGGGVLLDDVEPKVSTL